MKKLIKKTLVAASLLGVGFYVGSAAGYQAGAEDLSHKNDPPAQPSPGEQDLPTVKLATD